MSALSEWFTEQYGGLPSDRSEMIMRERVNSLEMQLHQAKSDLARMEKLSARWLTARAVLASRLAQSAPDEEVT